LGVCGGPVGGIENYIGNGGKHKKRSYEIKIKTKL
jgi:hypothetical protein